jgi:prepilin-type N-terminal cleavage/methylation domain-containing protein
MCATKKTANRRRAFTLVELLVVILIMLVIAALAAAFAPRVSDSQNLTRAVDQLEQWLLTAKMRAKRDQLATGVRFIQVQGDITEATGITCSQLQYIQQPDPLSGSPGGSFIQSAGSGTVTFGNVDFTMGGTLPPSQYLVQPGDYLEVRDGGVYQIGAVTGPATVTLAGTPYDASLNIGPTATPPTAPTTNYRILRQPRLLIGESPLDLPNNFAVDMRIIPGTIPILTPSIPANAIIPNNTTVAWSNVVPRVVPTTPAVTYYEILFSPTGAVVGTNAGNGKVLITVYDMSMNPYPPASPGGITPGLTSIPLWNPTTQQGPIIQALQITIRIWDQKTNQTRQVTIVQAM